MNNYVKSSTLNVTIVLIMLMASIVDIFNHGQGLIILLGAIACMGLLVLLSMPLRSISNLCVAAIIAVSLFADVHFHCQGLLLVLFAVPASALVIYLEDILNRSHTKA